MAKLVSLAIPKRTKKQMKEDMSVCCEPSNNKFPYGFRITLTNDKSDGALLDKFPQLADVSDGDMIDLVAKGTVIEVSSVKRQDAPSRRRVEIQIEQMAIKSDSQLDKDFDSED